MESHIVNVHHDENDSKDPNPSWDGNNEIIEALPQGATPTVASSSDNIEGDITDTSTMPQKFSLEEEGNEKSKYRNIVQILAVIAMSLGHFLDGSVLAFTSPLLPQLMKCDSSIPINQNQESFISSLHSVGATIGCLVAGIASKKLGRRGSVLFINIPAYFFGYTFLAFSKSPLYLYCGRFLSGFGIGITLSIPTVYIVEITSLEVRGMLGVLTNFFCQVGILTTYVAGYYFDWRTIALSMMVFCVPTTIFIWFIPESPVYYASIGEDKLARETLETLKLDSSPNAIKALHEKASEELKGMAVLKELKKSSALKPILCSITLFFFFQSTAYPILVGYAKPIFMKSGINIEENLASMIVGAVIVVGSLLSVPLAKALPRKRLLLISGGGVTVSLAILSLYFFLKDAKLAGDFPALPIVFFVIYLLFFMTGFGSISWLFIAEIIPPSIRATTYSFCVAINWMWNFAFTHSFMSLLGALNMSGTFSIYASLCLIGFIFVIFCLPETRNKSPGEIAEFFERSEKETAPTAIHDEGTIP